jgi:arabinogalactan oligomer/maltooligosaccharide transport system substrate-binding protein
MVHDVKQAIRNRSKVALGAFGQLMSSCGATLRRTPILLGRLPRLACLGLAILALLAATGCLRRKTEEVVTLRWWITYAEESSEYPVFERIAQAYAEETGYAVDLVAVSWEDLAPRGAMANTLVTEIQAGRGPDVWGPVPHNWIGAYARGGLVQALQEDQVTKRYEYLDEAMRACQYKGQQYALPLFIESVALIYNPSLLPEPPTSFEELIQAAKDLTDADEGRWGLVMPVLSQYHAYPFIDGYGGYLFNCDGEQCNPSDLGLNNEGGVKGIQFLSDLYLKEHILPESLMDRPVMRQEALDLFTEGRAAMLIDGPWVLPELRASGIDYSVAVIPKLPGTDRQPRPLTVVKAIYASAHSSHAEQALAFLDYIASPESVQAMAEVLDGTPVRRDARREIKFEQQSSGQAWLEQATIGVPLPNIPELDYVWAPWGQALDEAIPGLTPAQEALDRAVEQIKSYLDES